MKLNSLWISFESSHMDATSESDAELRMMSVTIESDVS